MGKDCSPGFAQLQQELTETYLADPRALAETVAAIYASRILVLGEKSPLVTASEGAKQ